MRFLAVAQLKPGYRKRTQKSAPARIAPDTYTYGYVVLHVQIRYADADSY